MNRLAAGALAAILFGAALALSGSLPGFGGWRETEESRYSFMERRDRNGDGSVTPDELPDEGVFARFDRDGDGLIRYAEAAPTEARRWTSGQRW